MSDERATHYVYSAWDADGQALYVGCTNNLARRMHEHANVPLSWVPRAVVMTALPFHDRREALSAETRQIAKLRPRYNVRHNPRFVTVAEAAAREAWSDDYADLNDNGAEGRARYLARHPEASANLRRWIALENRRDERSAA